MMNEVMNADVSDITVISIILKLVTTCKDLFLIISFY